jgi:hypothetical protein
MILHDIVYEWDGKSSSGEKPISWWPGSYHVKIVNLDSGSKDICFLIPVAVIFKNARNNPTMNTSLRNYIDNFAKKVSKTYDLEIEKTFWIEIGEEIMVARLHFERRLENEDLYTVVWCPIRSNELAMIEPYLGDM